ncbi:MAG: methylated-DNA--[protein]-cysteine S-methyltransferase [Proteobacteria bacterium]|nr:methylated-DNA--[protein]-cysteine S-methyltransferase [Pseudomonadota bacterium]
MNTYQAIIDTPIGNLGIQASETYLYRIDFLPKTIPLKSPCTFAAELTCQQLLNYFQDPNWIFELPCELSITPFQRRVLDQLCLIPPGKTLSYSDIAKKTHTGPRSVGTVCRLNPIPIVIPCHRVTGKHDIGGFGGAAAGPAITMKHWLLQHESSDFCKDSLTNRYTKRHATVVT